MEPVIINTLSISLLVILQIVVSIDEMRQEIHEEEQQQNLDQAA